MSGDAGERRGRAEDRPPRPGSGERRGARDRSFRATLRAVLLLVLATVGGFAVWYLRPPRVRVDVHVRLDDGSSREVRLAGRVVGRTPLVLTLDDLRAAERAEADPAGREARARTLVGRRDRVDLPRGAAVVHGVLPAPRGVWVHVQVLGALEPDLLTVPLEVGDPGDPCRYRDRRIDVRRGMSTHRVVQTVLFRTP